MLLVKFFWKKIITVVPLALSFFFVGTNTFLSICFLLYFVFFSLIINYPGIIDRSLFTLSLGLGSDRLGWGLAVLRVIVTLTIVCSFPLEDRFFLLINTMICSILIVAFLVKKIFYFYIFFELSLLPISIMIIGYGYQPERSSAFMYIFLYTAVASLPLIFLILNFELSNKILFFYEVSLYMGLDRTFLFPFQTFVIKFLFMLAFLVKFPIYGVHLWLPKAHVEAPVGGSMILAGLLLKLGGYGIAQIMPIFSGRGRLRLSLASYRLTGGVIIAVICLRQVDMKVLIAYSSVRHLRVCLAGFLIQSDIIVSGAVIVLLSHGLSSPGIFFGAHLIYIRRNTRNLLLNIGFQNLVPLFSFWWFLMCLANMGAPPMLNMWGELLAFWGSLSINLSFFIQMSLLVFFGGVYSLVIYSFRQQGQILSFSRRGASFSVAENRVLFSIIFLILGLSPIFYIL